jgi:hypothetical protein
MTSGKEVLQDIKGKEARTWHRRRASTAMSSFFTNHFLYTLKMGLSKDKKRHPPISGCQKNPPSVIRHQKSRAKRDITDGTGSCRLIIFRSLLVLLAQQVVYGLYRVEGRQGYLDHQCVPVAHGTVPETRKF